MPLMAGANFDIASLGVFHIVAFGIIRIMGFACTIVGSIDTVSIIVSIVVVVVGGGGGNGIGLVVVMSIFGIDSVGKAASVWSSKLWRMTRHDGVHGV